MPNYLILETTLTIISRIVGLIKFEVNLQKRYFNFHGIVIKLESDWNEVLELLTKDFSFFCTSSSTESADFEISIYNTPSSNIIIPNLISKMQTLNSITYQKDGIRFNDYYGKLISILNYQEKKAKLFSTNLNKMHEVTYLLILSVVGKKLDLLGIHKLHAFAVSYDDVVAVCMMPMKGGKSTLLLELLKFPEVKMLSDDIPLINRWGEVIPFPIKIGIDQSFPPMEIINPEKNIYQIQREHYGLKTLLSLDGIPDKVISKNKRFKKIILLEGFRQNSNDTLIKSDFRIKSIKGLVRHGIIGFGLPMVIEYFWEFGIKDFLIKIYIFLSRVFSFLAFSGRARFYYMYQGKEVPQAASQIVELLKNYK